jgi:hypothetical protein
MSPEVYSPIGRRRTAAGALTVSMAALAQIPGWAAAQVQFQDVTAQANLLYTGESYGASRGDMNGDGWPDLYVNRHRDGETLHINREDGAFADRWRDVDIWRQFPRLDTHGGTWAGFDRDGHEDLFVTTGVTDYDQLLVNDGAVLSDRTQSDVSAQVCVDFAAPAGVSVRAGPTAWR